MRLVVVFLIGVAQVGAVVLCQVLNGKQQRAKTVNDSGRRMAPDRRINSEPLCVSPTLAFNYVLLVCYTFYRSIIMV